MPITERYWEGYAEGLFRGPLRDLYYEIHQTEAGFIAETHHRYNGILPYITTATFPTMEEAAAEYDRLASSSAARRGEIRVVRTSAA